MIKKIVLRFFLHSKKGFKNYLKTEGLSQIRKKISRLHNEYILISDERTHSDKRFFFLHAFSNPILKPPNPENKSINLKLPYYHSH